MADAGRMKLGYSLPSNQGFEDVGEIVRLAVLAEELGFDGVWASEHLFHASYIAERLGDLPYYEPLTVLTAVSAATSRVRLGTTVLVLPWHDPPRLAKTVATLDQLSGGRVDLGVGVAMTEDEFENLGVDFKSRGRRTNEILAALQALWTEDVPTFEGEFYRYGGLKFSPKPKQTPYPPILVGGSSRAALRRTARYGDGWHTLRQSPAQVRAALPELAQLTAAEGRDMAALRISINIPVSFDASPSRRPPAERTTLKGAPTDVAETIRAYAAAGVDEVVMSHQSRSFDAHAATLRRLAAEVRPLLQQE